MSKNKNTNTNTNKNIKKKHYDVPNSLNIYIKTRVPNYFKLNYEPYMTVPTSTSKTVYFDPLIKYVKGPINNLPNAAPKDAIFTQFFQAAEFDSMINRILSDFRYMQKPRTIQQAYDQHIIDHNVEITLNTLFKTNNLFYINKNPYTIVNSHWKKGDWQIDKKPLEQLLSQFSFLTAKQVQEQAQREKDNIPESIRQGNLASSNLRNQENASIVAAGLQNAINKKNVKPIINQSDAFIPKDKLPGISGDLQILVTELLKQNPPINYSDTPDKERDPLTLSLLVNQFDLLNFINTNKDTKIIDLYSDFITAKSTLQYADVEYNESWTKLVIFKDTFDKELTNIQNIFEDNPNLYSVNKQQFNTYIQQITDLKIDYMKHIFKIADAIYSIYNLQHDYFVCTKLLLEQLKIDYVNIIQYYEQPLLAIKCIDYDISTIQSLIELDPENQYSTSYFSNRNDFELFYKEILYKNQQELLNPQINYLDEANIYRSSPGILEIEIKKYELYNCKMFLFYSYNQFSIWVTLFKTIEIFTKFINTVASDIIRNTQEQIDNYDTQFSKDIQQQFLVKTKAVGVRAERNNETKQLNWYLVTKNGTRCIKPNKSKSILPLNDLKQEKLYIETIRTQVKSYDAIIYISS
jgi:hypothetical protein